METSKNVYLCMLDVLQQLVEECQALPQDVLELILFQFKKKRQVVVLRFPARFFSNMGCSKGHFSGCFKIGIGSLQFDC
jgi:hypothetical protein